MARVTRQTRSTPKTPPEGTASPATLDPAPIRSRTRATRQTKSTLKASTPKAPPSKATTSKAKPPKPKPPKAPPSQEPTPAPSPATHLFPSAPAFDTWLTTHHATTPTGIWLQLSKKGTVPATLTYAEAVTTALRHGWIDGQRRSHTTDGPSTHFLQRFTPRRRNSLWSRLNVNRVAELTAAGLMLPAGQAEVDAAVADGRWARAYAPASAAEVPPDFAEALRGNAAAEAFFGALGRSKRYSFIWRVETARRAETRERRIREFVGLLAEGKTL